MKTENALEQKPACPPPQSKSATAAQSGILRELRGTLAIEGIVVSDEQLADIAAEHAAAAKRGEIAALVKRAKRRFQVAKPTQ